MFNIDYGKKPCHIFIRGYKQSGKTTLVNKVLKDLDIPYKGLLSYSLSEPCQRKVFIKSITGDSESYLCGVCRGGRVYEDHSNVFDEYGVKWVDISDGTKLVVIDEVGFIEESAPFYRNAIMSLLERTDIMVLGTIREGGGMLTEEIYRHPNVKTFTLRTKNRDNLVPVVKRLLNHEIAN